MGNNDEELAVETAARAMRDLGLDGFMEQMGHLQASLDKVGQGMESLGASVARQSTDTENLAAHVLALESLMAVILRQIPVDIAEVRREANRRANTSRTPGDRTNSVVANLAEDIIKRADD